MVEAYYRIRREVREESKTMWIAKFLFPLAKRFSSVAYSPLPRFPCAHLPPDSSPSTSTTAQQPPVVVAHNVHADAYAVTAYCLRARNSPSTGLPTPSVDLHGQALHPLQQGQLKSEILPAQRLSWPHPSES